MLSIFPCYISFQHFLYVQKTKQWSKCFTFQLTVRGMSGSTLHAIVVLWMIQHWLRKSVSLNTCFVFVAATGGSRGIMCCQITLLLTKQKPKRQRSVTHKKRFFFLLLKLIHLKAVISVRGCALQYPLLPNLVIQSWEFKSYLQWSISGLNNPDVNELMSPQR